MTNSRQDELPRSGTLSVVGVGEVRVNPDVAWVNLGVTTRGAIAEQAVSANIERMKEVLGRLRALGIKEEALQSGEPVVFPILHHEEGPKKGQIIGYGAENHVTVRTDIEQAGKVFDEGIGAGANHSSTIAFGLRDETPMRKLALDVAVRSAYSEAQLIADATGVRLQGPHSMDIARAGGPIVTGHAQGPGARNPSGLPGKLTLTAKVTIGYTYLYSSR
ncbi:MAG: SIMPL domain-containing protein [Polyangia bacterium]